MTAWVYILLCADGSYYVGSARGDLGKRIDEHHVGRYGGYTAIRRPLRLVFSQECQQIADAIALERRIKGWRRDKKEALVRGDFHLLPALAKRGRTAGS